MARIRSIKPDAFTSETLAQVPVVARWTFAGLWTYCDDQGRGKADPRLIKAAVYPLDDEVTVRDIDSHLDALERLGRVCRYEVAGRAYLHCTTFGEHQHPSKPQPSKLPPCPKQTHGSFPEESGNAAGALPVGIGGEEDREEEEEKESSSAEPPRVDVNQLCTRLADRIEANGSKRPRITAKWRDAARLLLDRDGRTLDEALRLVDWSQRHSFWHTVILSMQSFRDSYDKMRLQAVNGRGAPATAQTGYSDADRSQSSAVMTGNEWREGA